MGRDMLKKLFVAVLFSALFTGCSSNITQEKTDIAVESSPAVMNGANLKFTNHNFPSVDEIYKPPDWWGNRPTFQLSQNYPDNPPPKCPPTVCRWKNFDASTQPDKYMQAVLQYIYEGNIETDWKGYDNPVRRWYHAPYMHRQTNGREFVRGMTRERTGCLSELLNGQPCPINCEGSNNPKCFQSWAVSLYNEQGAYYINRVWTEVLKSNRNPNIFSEGFPEDSVSFKLLFTAASDKPNPATANNQIPYLKDGIEWQADTKRIKQVNISQTQCANLSCLTTLRLLQIDVAVRDIRADKTGWVFGSYIYKFDEKKPDKWQRIEPIGLMFGNSLDPNQSRLNRNLGIPQHYGCPQTATDPFLRRMNGPVDNPKSSCLSCHSLAETPGDLSIGRMPYKNMDCNNDSYWFRNINPHSQNPNERTFTPDVFTLDYSLQLREGIMRYCDQYKERCGTQFDNSGRTFSVTKNGIIFGQRR